MRHARFFLLPVLLAGCFDEPPDARGLVFDDAFPAGVGYQPFLNSKLDAMTVDTAEHHEGSASLRFDVPAPGDPGAGAFGFSGGAITDASARDLSAFNALVFWAKASRDVTIDTIGLGNDNTGTSRHQTEAGDLAVGTSWKRYVLPLPDPSKVTRERGLFWLADAADGEPATAYAVWFDDLRYDTVDASTWNPRPGIESKKERIGVGETLQLGGTSAIYSLGGTDVRFAVFPACFEFTSSAPAVAVVTGGGLVRAVDVGVADVTGTLNGAPADGSVEITVAAGLNPVEAPPAPPARDPGDVIALLSTAYTTGAVDTWGAPWSNLETGPNLTETTVGGEPVKKYADLLYVGIEFTGVNAVDAAAMTHFHLDVWTPDADEIKLKLVDFGGDGAFGGGDDAEAEIAVGATFSPPLSKAEWVSLDVPLASFAGLTSRGHLSQLVISASRDTVYIANVYFHR